MPTEKQSWLNRYETYYAQTEYNKKHYGKRIKQLKHMLEDEDFLAFLYDTDCKEDILEYLAKSSVFDMYIAWSEQGNPYIHDNKEFQIINHMKKMLGRLQSDGYLKDSVVRKQAKRYVQMYVWFNKEAQKEAQDDLPDLPF